MLFTIYIAYITDATPIIAITLLRIVAFSTLKTFVAAINIKHNGITEIACLSENNLICICPRKNPLTIIEASNLQSPTKS
ncbi:hypothetical protein MGH68_00395 [Erysipelothrix sp. D19-032]